MDKATRTCKEAKNTKNKNKTIRRFDINYDATKGFRGCHQMSK